MPRMTLESAYSKVIRVKRVVDGHWVIPGNIGRPTINVNGEKALVSRVVAAVRLGLDISDTSVLVCHKPKCTNSGCVRPSHLYLGNKSTNKMDYERTLYGNL